MKTAERDIETLTKKETSEETKGSRAAEARGKRGDSYKRLEKPWRRDRAEKVIEKRQTWYTEEKQSPDKDKGQPEREFVSTTAVWSSDSAEILRKMKRKWGKQITIR